MRTSSILCTGQTTARLRGSSGRPLPPTASSRLSPTATKTRLSLKPGVHMLKIQFSVGYLSSDCPKNAHNLKEGQGLGVNDGNLTDALALCRFWRGLYNHFDRGMHPRQSVEDYLQAIQEETQQLHDQLASHKQVGAALSLLTASHFS